MLPKQTKRIARHRRIRTQVQGTSECPRLAVFRSRAHIYAQLIDDTTGKTLVAASDMKISGKGTPVEMAEKVGEELAGLAKKLKLQSVVFDRGGFKYHGRVKALADGARKGGLEF